MLVALSSLLLVGCGQQKANKDTEMTALRDSLNQIISQKDNEIDGMMETFNDIEAGFREIDAAEGRVALARQGEGANAKERIRENMEFIKDAMARNKELINKLRQQLRESTIKGNALKTTIENMMKQIEEKDKKIQDLIEELDAKDIHISRLDEEVANLNTNVSNLTEETNQKTQTINTQDNLSLERSRSSSSSISSRMVKCCRLTSTRVISRRSISVLTRRLSSTLALRR